MIAQSTMGENISIVSLKALQRNRRKKEIRFL